ncbi:MAG TPA: hypothetical protein VHQ20_01505 [Patescibacteria group bacterium]|jgi:hypothetical protein|nr:hypothetical protein [Patescibacteria group bacterium]
MTQKYEVASWDLEEFQNQWIKVSEEVIAELMANSDIEKIKQNVRSKGHVEFEDRDQFINLVNKIKYEVIYKKFGPEDSDGYKAFEKAWQHWHNNKATSMAKPENMFEENIYHLMFGSTPDPDAFLKDFDVNKT